MSKLFCPRCGEQNVTRELTPEGGWLYVAEEIDDSSETFDATIELHKCGTCDAIFYTSDEKL